MNEVELLITNQSLPLKVDNGGNEFRVSSWIVPILSKNADDPRNHTKLKTNKIHQTLARSVF